MCETCNQLICDKCEIEDHSNHKTSKFDIQNSTDYIMNILSNFYSKLKKTQDENLKNFSEKMDSINKNVQSFFEDELIRVESTTKEITVLLSHLTNKIRKLISMYQKKFKEEFEIVKEEYYSFSQEIVFIKNKIDLFKSNNIKEKNKFKEFKEFKQKKLQLEKQIKRLMGFVDFNKTALISEFSMKNFYSFLEKNKIFLTKHNEEYDDLIKVTQVRDRISKVTNFDESKMLFSSKNFLPRNLSTIYLPIDDTNTLITYNSETEIFLEQPKTTNFMSIVQDLIKSKNKYCI